ncbi:MAG: calcium-binding protein [Betaproteobacteria bacterium]|nr:calcium-binding protein [Betaproteobacteria bacterium]
MSLQSTFAFFASRAWLSETTGWLNPKPQFMDALTDPSNGGDANTDSEPTLPEPDYVGDDVIEGTELNDAINASDGDDVVSGEGGDDSLWGGYGRDTLLGGSGGDDLYGESDSDLIEGGDGEDQISGGPGDDVILGGDGDDQISGDPGDDVIDGEGGNDTIFGGDGKDTLVGGDGLDVLFGGTGDDSLLGGIEYDFLDGDTGNDQLFGAEGEDTLIGGDGHDYLSGGDDADLMDGGQGDDTLIGGAGDDLIVDLFGRNRFEGGAGEDIIRGGNGMDVASYAGKLGDFELRLALNDESVVIDLRGPWTIDKGVAPYAFQGIDSVRNVERYIFSDFQVAADLDANAGAAARILATCFGKSFVSSPTFSGIALKVVDQLVDSGSSPLGAQEQIAAFALDLVLGPNASKGSALVELVWQNLVGSPIDPQLLADVAAVIDGGAIKPVQFMTFISNLDYTGQAIGLVGLAQSGWPYLPPAD